MDMERFPKLFEPHFCTVSPHAQSFVEMEGEITEESVAEFNQGRIRFLNQWHQGAPIGNVERHEFLYRNKEYQGTGLVYRPRDCGEELLPVVVYYHGGGWTTLCKECYEYECAAIAEQAQCVVFNMDYRCAPKYQFPVPLEDCYAGLEAAVSEAGRFGGDPSRLAVAGDSAGGNLALALAILARRRGGPKISYLALAYPAVGVDTDRDDFMEEITFGYTGKRELFDDPLVSPILDETPEAMPPMLIVIGSCDFLLDQNLRYVRLVQEHGGDVELALYQGMPHGFIQMTVQEGKDSVSLIAHRIRERLYRN